MASTSSRALGSFLSESEGSSFISEVVGLVSISMREGGAAGFLALS